MKFSNDKHNLKNWANSDLHNSQDRKEIRNRDLETDGCQRQLVGASRLENSQIHLTQDISITQEPLTDASFRPGLGVVDHRW